MKIVTFLIVFSQLLISGCAYYPSKRSIGIVESDYKDVAKCKLVGQVYGDQKAMPFLAVGLEIAKDEAKDRAAMIGATHVSWDELNTRGAPFAIGRAYQCGQS